MNLTNQEEGNSLMDTDSIGSNTNNQNFPSFPLAELHAHLGTSISPATLWQIAHDLGFKLPKDDFVDFTNYVMLSRDRRMKLETYFKEIYHPLLDKLSSGTHAVEQATYHSMAGAYRSQGITLLELRNNPMKHNANAQLDLDHIIMAMLRGMERALLEYKQLRAGLIFCMGREFGVKQNAIIIDKAIKYHSRGVVGIDVAGPAVPGFHFQDYEALFKRAKKAGLRVTVHSGETPGTNDMWEALKYVKPERFGHGIYAAYDKPLMKEIVKRGIVLEVCPLSNIATKAVKDISEMKFILRTLIDNKVRFCINTDWPEIIVGCHLRSQLAMLRDEGMLSEEEIEECNKEAFEASFVPKHAGLEAYL
jgi:adenosine deaminase